LLVEAGELTRVLRRLDPDPGVRLVEGMNLGRRGVVEQLERGLLGPDEVEALAGEADPRDRVGPLAGEEAEDRLDERPGERSGRDHHLPAGLDVEALLDEQLRVLLDARIGHAFTPSRTVVRMRGPSSVIATVCSKWAESDPSPVEIDHSSSWTTTSGPPALIIGSIANVIP